MGYMGILRGTIPPNMHHGDDTEIPYTPANSRDCESMLCNEST